MLTWHASQTIYKLLHEGLSRLVSCCAHPPLSFHHFSCTLLARAGNKEQGLGPFVFVLVITMVLMVGPPYSAQALCCQGVLHLLQLELAWCQVLQPVCGVVLEGGGPGRSAVDLQGDGQGRCSHTGRRKARAVQIKKPELQQKAAGTVVVSSWLKFAQTHWVQDFLSATNATLGTLILSAGLWQVARCALPSEDCLNREILSQTVVGPPRKISSICSAH